MTGSNDAAVPLPLPPPPPPQEASAELSAIAARRDHAHVFFRIRSSLPMVGDAVTAKLRPKDARLLGTCPAASGRLSTNDASGIYVLTALRLRCYAWVAMARFG